MLARRAGIAMLVSLPLAAQEPGFRVEPVVTGLAEACAMAFTPDGRLLVVERRTGRIMIVEHGAVTGTWATVAVFADDGARGAMGIAVDPGFVGNGFVYVSHTEPAAAANAVVRFTEVAGQGTAPLLLPPRSASAFAHAIGPMAFGADGRLYVVVGDAADPSAPQDLGNLNGKVWRLATPDGAVPADNPFPGSHVYSYGHRNSFGICAHPRRADVYQTENGLLIDDEFNLLLPGRNYGWPMHDGRELTPDPTTEDPLYAFQPQTAPTGCAFAAGPLYPAPFREGWFVGDWIHGELTFVDLDAVGRRVLATRLLVAVGRRIFAVADGPDGCLWVLYAATEQTPYGADSVARIVWDQSPRPALAAGPVSSIALGASITIGATAAAGDTVLAWLGAQRFPAGLPTPFGELWVPIDVALPARRAASDGRAYLALVVPGDPALRGAEVHLQAAAVSPAGTRLTNPDSVLLR